MTKKIFFIFIGILLFSCGRNSREDNHPKPPLDRPFELVKDRWYVQNGKIFSPSGDEWRGVGTNLTNLMGRSDEFIRNAVKRESKMKFSFIRLWTPDHNSTGPKDMVVRANQVVRILDIIASYHMKVMVVFWDTYSDLWGNSYAIHRDPEWFKQTYKGDFLAWVKILTEKIRNHPALFMYQLINESSCRVACAPDYLNMYNDTAAVIRSLDPKHLISPGGLSLAHALEGGSYGGSVDLFIKAMLATDDQIVWTDSIYSRSEPNRNDLVALKNRIPIIVTEFGFCVNNKKGIKGEEGFFNKEWGGEALFKKWHVSGIAAWEAEERNCGYANRSASGFDLSEPFKNLAIKYH